MPTLAVDNTAGGSAGGGDLLAFIDVKNIADKLSDQKLHEIADEAMTDYEIDRDSMGDWLKRMEKGIKLAQLIKTDKTYPWKNASNIVYPLVTTAALQFNAKAYPAIVQPDEVVKPKIFGRDRNGEKAAKGRRACEYMSWQCLSQIEEWETDTDKLLVVLSIVGTLVRKTWFDPVKGRIRCRFILPDRFTLNDSVKNIDDAPRCTEDLPLYPSEIMARRRSGTFRDIDYIEALSEDKQKPEDFIEQHRLMDLDEDGVDEPYIVTVHKVSRTVARIVADYDEGDILRGDDGQVVKVQRNSYFTDFQFLPAMDGGFWGTGLGILLGDLSDTVSSIVNMMLDAGHMQAMGSGWIGTEFRIKGGSQYFQPGEYKLAANSGDDIRKAIVDRAIPGPSDVLFQLLGLLIEAAKDISSTKDILTGDTEGKSNMPVGTTLALIEQGMAQFTAAYKRIYRSLRTEFKLIARINQKTVDPEEYNRFLDETQPVVGPDGQPVMDPDGKPQLQPMLCDPRKDFDLQDLDFVPTADPSSVTKLQEMQKAQMLMEMGEKGMVNMQKGTERILEAASIPDTEELIPQPDPMQVQAVQLQNMLVKAQGDEAGAKAMLAQAQAMALQGQGGAEQAKAQADIAKAQADVQSKTLEANLKGAELQLKQAELQLKTRESEVGTRETMAKVEKLMAEVEAIRAGIQQKNAEIEINAHKTSADVQNQQQQIAMAGQKTAADIENQRAQTAIAGRKTEADIEHQGRQTSVAETKTVADIRNQDRQTNLAQRKGEADIAKGVEEIEIAKRSQDTTEKKTDADIKVGDKAARVAAFKAASDAGNKDGQLELQREVAESSGETKPKKSRFKVTKHDDKGRIAEIEREDS